MQPILLLIALPLLIELFYTLRGLEKHEYIEGSYQHSIQHFAYLCIYGIGLILLGIGIKDQGYFMLALGTLVFLWHVRNERKNLLK